MTTSEVILFGSPRHDVGVGSDNDGRKGERLEREQMSRQEMMTTKTTVSSQKSKVCRCQFLF